MRVLTAVFAYVAIADAYALNWDTLFAATSASAITLPTPHTTEPADLGKPPNGFSKRYTNTTSTCTSLPTGMDIHPSPDTAAAFLADARFSSAALAAPVPTGFTQVYSNMNASSYNLGYLGFDWMDTYDAQRCSDQCRNIYDCVSVNIYFERNPSVVPESESCPNPSSTTRVVCAYYSGPLDQASAINPGVWREQFQVVRAGSNGYVDSRIMAPSGYGNAEGLGNATVTAPLDCSGSDTYIGLKLFTDMPFNASRCATHCTDTSNWNSRHGFWQTCQFFSTYILFKDGQIVGQHCAMYTKAWDRSYATNTGYWASGNHYTIGYSFSYSNATNAGTSRQKCNTRRQLSSEAMEYLNAL